MLIIAERNPCPPPPPIPQQLQKVLYAYVVGGTDG